MFVNLQFPQTIYQILGGNISLANRLERDNVPGQAGVFREECNDFPKPDCDGDDNLSYLSYLGTCILHDFANEFCFQFSKTRF